MPATLLTPDNRRYNYADAMQRRAAEHRAGFIRGVILPVAGAVAGGTLGSMLGRGGSQAAALGSQSSAMGSTPSWLASNVSRGLGGVGAGVGQTISNVAPAVTQTAAQSGFMSSVLPHVISGAVGLGTTYMGARAQSRANEQAAASERDTLTYYRERDSADREEQRRIAEIEQRNFEAQQQLEREKWEFERDRYFEDQAEQERRRGEAAAAHAQAQAEYDARIAPRRALRDQALQNLGSLLTQGTPGYGQPNAFAAPQGFTLGDLIKLPGRR